MCVCVEIFSQAKSQMTNDYPPPHFTHTPHTQSSANVAVARLNNSDELGMKRMSVAISNPPKGGSKGTFGGPEPETGFKRPTFAPRDMQDNNPM